MKGPVLEIGVLPRPACQRFFPVPFLLAFSSTGRAPKNAHSLRKPEDQLNLISTKKKTHRNGCVFFLVAGVGLEPHDLRVMSPTSYQLLHPAIWATISYCKFIICDKRKIVKYFLYKALLHVTAEYFAEKNGRMLSSGPPGTF